MQERNKLDDVMQELICHVASDITTGITRFLQANPYSSFEYYNFSIFKDKVDIFEKTLYCESEKSKLYKEQIYSMLKNPNGKNTFFLVGYQGCGKSTFIQSVINLYKKSNSASVVVIDCDKNGKSVQQIRKTICRVLKNMIKDSSNFSDFVDFYEANYDVIDEFGNDKFDKFYELIKDFNTKGYTPKDRKELKSLSSFINEELLVTDAYYLVIFWALACKYGDCKKSEEKLMIFIDNLDCIDEYHELIEFISCVDAVTVELSNCFERFRLCKSVDIGETFVSKIKIFIAMRETTKANLPSSHFSNAFRSIYTNKDMTEWYDKTEIIKRRVSKLLEYDKKGILKSEQNEQLHMLLKVTEDIYTRNVIYPLFNNNFRSAVDMLVCVVMSHIENMKKYEKLMRYNDPRYKHGARGILFKYIFDEFNKGDGNEESCFKRIGVLDLLNRKNNSVSICRLILSYLSNYTETKCDSGRNSITLREIINSFKNVFPEDEVVKTLCEMFSLRDSKWSHLVSFNQIEYKNTAKELDGHIDIKELDPDKTMIHYSCAGKIYIEYVATHFEFFTARIFKERREALFCDSNLDKDQFTNNYKCCDVIDKVFSEVKLCCASLKNFDIELCSVNNCLDPYKNPELYIETPYICMFKREEYEGRERRFKQFHEERILLTHINYIDCYRMYLLNHCDEISHDEKVKLNEELTMRIKKYVELLASDIVLKNKYTNTEFIEHYNSQIEHLESDWTDFTTEISKNS